MAPRRRKATIKGPSIQPAPVPTSFLSLPDAAHASIASFLPDGNDSRLRTAEVSRALFDSYGGSLVCICIKFREESSAARLAALLRRNKELADVTLHAQEAIPAFCQAIIQGCCRRVERIDLFEGLTVMTQAHLNLVAGALEVDGALAKLQTLQVHCTLPGGISILARVLARGAAPLLQRFFFDAAGSNEADLISIADMIEARARIPACTKIDSIEGKDCRWFDAVPRPTKIRLLRALLPSATDLQPLTWRRAFQACFRERRAPYLTTLDVCLGDDVAGISCKVFEAAPALAKMSITGLEQTPLGAAALQSISTALRNGALQNLEKVVLRKCTLGNGDIRGFADALEESGCATRLVSLTFVSCGVGVEGVRIVADLIGQGVFPALKLLNIGENPDVSDVGVLALAEALVKSNTFLRVLDLQMVGMGDKGLVAVASLVDEGCLVHLEELSLAQNDSLTDQGLILLSQAIDIRGLLKLRILEICYLTNLTGIEISAISLAVIKGCPQLEEIQLMGSGPENGSHRETITGMLEETGRVGKVKVIYDEEDDGEEEENEDGDDEDDEEDDD